MMKLVRANGRCSRCNQRWTARNAMALAAQHHQRTGHPVEVDVLYRAGETPRAINTSASLPFGK